MLPPDTAVMWDTRDKRPASARNRTRPRWYRLARKPPPERASPIFFMCAARARVVRRTTSGGPDRGQRDLGLDDGGQLAECEHLFGRRGCEQVHAACDDPRPAGLVARPEAGPVVAVEVLVEQDQVAP